jgi:capsular polysaccharide biosynthesis protein
VDPGRFNNLAVLYSQLATGDQVRLLMRRDGPLRGQIIASPVVGGGEFKTQLPMIDLTAISTTPRGAIHLAQRSSNALTTYIRDKQRASNVPATDRAMIVPVVRPAKVVLFRPRSKTMPIVVFLAVAFVTVGLAFVLENLRPVVRETDLKTHADFEGAKPTKRRTA